MGMTRAPVERAGLWFGLAVLVVLAASTWLDLRDLRTSITEHSEMGAQSISTTLPDMQVVVTERALNERIEDWLARHQAAIAAVEGQ